ncbi:hypothetical protein HAX54_038223 [Datura stramonium]|uniref:Uncharacterized protein n=1 Tax=Datura stramonium TaxID=4076 RepID=A0ABS8RMU1_DATST|nr:hypothetical protein [Datura stramonium]
MSSLREIGLTRKMHILAGIAVATLLFYGVVKRGERDGRGLVVVDLGDVWVNGGDGVTGDGSRGRIGNGYQTEIEKYRRCEATVIFGRRRGERLEGVRRYG